MQTELYNPASPLFSPVFKRPGSVDVTAARFSALIAAVIIYALAGSPSPDSPGIVEIMIGLLLIMAVGLPALWRAFSFDPARPLWQSAGWCLLLYGFVIAIPAGVLHGNDPGLILRDLPAFLFLLLPLMGGDIFEKRPDYLRIFVSVFAFTGLMFSFRGLGETSLFNPLKSEDSRELYYFANSPSVLFAAVFPAGLALEKYLQSLSFRSAALLIGAALCTLLPVIAMACTLQRASLGFVVLAFAGFAVVGLWRYPYRIIPMIFLALAILFLLHEHVFAIFDLLSHKTAVYGVNKRGMEMEAVWRDISFSLSATFFGFGWGGTFESPAVGGVRINYTHSFISGMLLKTGIIGAFLGLTYIAGFFMAVVRQLRGDFVLAVALAGPLAIDAFLYASYKWLDFGLLLLLIMAAQLHHSARYCIHKT